MVLRLRRFLDVRPGEGLRVVLAFWYIATVVAAFLLAKPIRNGLFLTQYGAYALVYVYAAVPLVLSLFVFMYARVTGRFGTRAVTVGTLVFFSLNALLFWYAFRFHPALEAPKGSLSWYLPGFFYVWVSCFGIIAPVQAWTFANSLFDSRQAKRLFGVIGAGASLGAIGGGLLARYLAALVGDTINMMLVLSFLILTAAGIVSVANVRIQRRGLTGRARTPRQPFSSTIREIGGRRYLRLLAALVFLVAIATQWTAFQLSLAAGQRFADDTDALTRFFGTFNVVLGCASLAVQLLLTAPALRRFGVALTILLLPLSLGLGSTLILLVPAFWPVLLTSAFDQGLRFSLDKATYELLYLPLPVALRGPVKSAIDIVVNRFADAIGAVILGVATRGFFMLPGMGLSLKGTAAVNLVFIGAWMVVAWRLRTEYVYTIQESIHRHRIDSEHLALAALDKPATEALATKLADPDADEVRYALSLLEGRAILELDPALRELLSHPEPDIRRRALAVLGGTGNRTIAEDARRLLRDPDPGVRTEALLYVTRELGADPLHQLEALGDFEDFSIRAGMAAFLASPGPAQNLDAARLILEAMASSPGAEGANDRTQAARIIALVPDPFLDLLTALVGDEDVAVARQAIRSAGAVKRDELVTPLVGALAHPDLADEAATALASYGDSIVFDIERLLISPETPLEIRRELPVVLVRIGTPLAEQILIESLLQGDVTLRHRIIASLNKLHDMHEDVRIDHRVVELVLAAEIAGHYRSYQVLGPLRARLKEHDPILEALRHLMEQELERIFRLMSLLFTGPALHDAYVGVRSDNAIVRANALEFLENVLKPELREVLLPLLDSQVSVDERIALANRLVGAPLETAEQAISTLLSSEDGWLRSCAVYAVGALQLHGLEPEVRRLQDTPELRDGVETALRRLAGEEAAPEAPVPAGMTLGIGAG